jgi:hypothetical protein
MSELTRTIADSSFELRLLRGGDVGRLPGHLRRCAGLRSAWAQIARLNFLSITQLVLKDSVVQVQYRGEMHVTRNPVCRLVGWNKDSVSPVDHAGENSPCRQQANYGDPETAFWEITPLGHVIRARDFSGCCRAPSRLNREFPRRVSG